MAERGGLPCLPGLPALAPCPPAPPAAAALWPHSGSSRRPAWNSGKTPLPELFCSLGHSHRAQTRQREACHTFPQVEHLRTKFAVGTLRSHTFWPRDRHVQRTHARSSCTSVARFCPLAAPGPAPGPLLCAGLRWLTSGAAPWRCPESPHPAAAAAGGSRGSCTLGPQHPARNTENMNARRSGARTRLRASTLASQHSGGTDHRALLMHTMKAVDQMPTEAGTSTWHRKSARTLTHFPARACA